MRFKLDENMPLSLVHSLTAVGHDAETCAQEGLGGTDDSTLAAHAAAETRILVTFELDFADIRRYKPGSHAGIVIFRLQSQDAANCQRAFARLFASVTEADFQGTLIIVEETRVRIRR